MQNSVDNPKFPPIELRRFDDYKQKLGDMLRGRRAEKGGSLLNIEEDLGIRRYLIVAIEKCDPTAFENPYFIPSYVKSYARYLGLDPERVYQQFCDECSFALPEENISFPANSSDGLFDSSAQTVPWSIAPQPAFSITATSLVSIVVLVTLAGGAGYFGFSMLKEFQQISSVSTPVEPEIDFAENDLTPTYFLNSSIDQTEAPVDGGRFTGSYGTLEPIGVLEPGKLGNIAENQESSEPGVQDELGGQSIVPVAVAVPTVVEPPKPKNEVRIFAARPAWVRVKAADDTVLLEKILDAGETYLVPKTDGEIKLRAGNSGSVYFDIDGQLFGPAGRKTGVVKDLILRAESLREKYELADEKSLPAPAQVSLVAARTDNDTR